MTLEQEMQLWESRNNDSFGQYLKSVEKVYVENLGEEEGEYGFKSNPISHLSSLYALDGDAKNIYKRVRAIIEDYDLAETSDELTFDFANFKAA